MRRLVFLVCLSALLAPAGCNRPLKEDTIFNPGYYARHVKKFLDDCHDFRIDVDRTVFGLEDVPLEEW
jgi:hypothetical protein